MIRGIAETVAARLADWLSEAKADRRSHRRADLLDDGYLIQRQVEQITIDLDRPIDSRLSVHLTIPAEAETGAPSAEGSTFLIPMTFLPKAEPRLGLTVLDEPGGAVPALDREECDRISAVAVAAEVQRVMAQAGRSRPLRELEEVMLTVTAEAPFQASLAVSEILEQIGEVGGPRGDRASDAWRASGILPLLTRLVEHSVVWVALRGEIGERRVLTVCRRMPVTRQSVLRWSFGDLSSIHFSALRPFRSRRASRVPGAGLQLGGSVYGRRSYRLSFSILWARFWRWLALRPTDFEVAAVSATRSDVYELEMRCSKGLAPRGVRVFTGIAITEPSARGTPNVQTTLTADTAHVRLTRPASLSDLYLRFTIGLAPHTILALWWLTCGLAAALLWMFTASTAHLIGGDKSIAAALSLAGFSFLAGQAAKAWTADRPLPGPASILLFCAIALSSAALLLIGIRPFGVGEGWAWSALAAAATVAAALLLVAWLLTRDAVWGALAEIGDAPKRRLAEFVLTGCGAAAAGSLLLTDPTDPVRATFAMFLVMLAVLSIAFAGQVDRARSNWAGSPLLAGVALLLLGCVELRGALVHVEQLQASSERLALFLLVFSTFSGSLLNSLRRLIRPTSNEVRVSPEIGRAIIAGERLRELQVLRSREVQDLG
jgi:hypothetical protein